MPGGALPGQQEAVIQHVPELAMTVEDALGLAREDLEKGDLPSALQLYEQIVHSDVDLAGPLTTMSADLGATGQIAALAEFLAPIYEPARHGPHPGINLLQAYLHLKNADAAQQLLDILDAQRDPELAERVAGFRTALEQLRRERPAEVSGEATLKAAEVQLITISKPLFTYGLADGEMCLPTKTGRERRMAFLPIALTGNGVTEGQPAPGDHPLAALACGLPLALAEATWFSPSYRATAVEGITPEKTVFLTPRAFRGEQARELFPAGEAAMNYAVSGTMHGAAGGTVAALEFTVWDVRKRRLLKTLRAEGDGAVATACSQLLLYIEADQPGPAPWSYALPADFAAHAVAHGHALWFFLAEKKVLSPDRLRTAAASLTALADYAASATAAATARFLLIGALRQATAARIEIPAEVSAIAERLTAP